MNWRRFKKENIKIKRQNEAHKIETKARKYHAFSHLTILTKNLWQEVRFFAPNSGSNSSLFHECLTHF